MHDTDGDEDELLNSGTGELKQPRSLDARIPSAGLRGNLLGRAGQAAAGGIWRAEVS
jgi:hypothetical protein